MKVLAKVTLVVNKTEYAPDMEVEISNEKEAESLIERGFASRIVKNESQSSQPPSSSSSKQDNSQKSDKNASKSTKNDKNTLKKDEKSKKEIDNSGAAVSKSSEKTLNIKIGTFLFSSYALIWSSVWAFHKPTPRLI